MRLATSVSGVGEPTLVLLHGLASTRRIWDLVIPHLAGKHRVLAYDQRGHGESDKPDDGYSIDTFADDLEEVLRRHGVSRPLLVGHSFGANVALRHAVTRRAARGLVLVDGAIVEMHAHLSWERAERELAPPQDDPADVERWVREGPRAVEGVPPLLPNTPEVVEVRRSLFEGSGPTVRRRLGRERHLLLLRSGWEQDVHAELARVECPVLALVCRISMERAPGQRWAERKETDARWVARLPRVELRWLEDSVHDVPLQRPRELAQTLLAFARDASTPRSRVAN